MTPKGSGVGCFYVLIKTSRTFWAVHIFIFDGWDEISTAANQGFRDSIDQVLG